MEGCSALAGSERDVHFYKERFLFTHSVEWEKLDCILREGVLRPIRVEEFASRMVKIYTPYLEKVQNEEIEAMVDQAKRCLQGETLEKESSFLQYYQRESKIFLGLAAKESITDSTTLRVRQMWGKYRAMLIYTTSLLLGREDYILSVGQANCPFDPDNDCLPGEGEKFEQLLSRWYKPQDYHLNSEVKFTHPISNERVSSIYAREQDQEQFLERYGDRIVPTGPGTWKIKVLEDEGEGLYAPLFFIPFNR